MCVEAPPPTASSCPCREVAGKKAPQDDFLGLQRDLGAVLAGQSGLNRNGLRLSRNPSIKRKAVAKAGPAPAADPRHRNPRKFLRSDTTETRQRRWRRRRQRGLRRRDGRRTPLRAGALARRTGSLSAETGRRGAARGRGGGRRKTDRWEGEDGEAREGEGAGEKGSAMPSLQLTRPAARRGGLGGGGAAGRRDSTPPASFPLYAFPRLLFSFPSPLHFSGGGAHGAASLPLRAAYLASHRRNSEPGRGRSGGAVQRWGGSGAAARGGEEAAERGRGAQRADDGRSAAVERRMAGRWRRIRRGGSGSAPLRRRAADPPG
ncbi:hypothetical protein PVAP13_2NG582600 [Panicum virgatum]|uniref:Uncharacterized protein n=1 Tax=Panicum virgatum TaxID=38727 RepID=A0A8T0VYM5_PANVG|nr:hypothetical protein PVAP13_2NG582600 [Panicum virgatum]